MNVNRINPLLEPVIKTEIERKWILNPSNVPVAGGLEVGDLEQIYLVCHDDREIRIRRTNQSTRAVDTADLTMKVGRGLERKEAVIPISIEAYEVLAEMSDNVITKKRSHFVLSSGHLAEVDAYRGSNKGLIVVEVEFESRADAGTFEPPDWFGSEITGYDAFSNRALAHR